MGLMPYPLSLMLDWRCQLTDMWGSGEPHSRQCYLMSLGDMCLRSSVRVSIILRM